MTIDPNIMNLINAEIDGMISPADKQELDAAVAASPEVRAMHAALSGLGASLNALPDLEPPPHLRHTIMAAIPASRERVARGGVLRNLFAAPALRYAATFAAGGILSLSLISSDRMANNAFSDVTGLVGTISADVPQGPGIQVTSIDRPEVAGRVSLRNSGRLLIVDFDLVSSGPIDIVASYSDQTIWFNGFAQLESPGASISAESGQVTMKIDGKRRYALFLHNAGDREVAINLQFRADGAVVYDTNVNYTQPGQTG